MLKSKNIWLILAKGCLIASLCYACQQKAERVDITTNKNLYPNNDARLAVLMRKMDKDMRDIKKAIENGEALPTYSEDYLEIKTAKSTDPSVKTEAFALMADNLLEQLDKLQNTAPESLEAQYLLTINACLACHVTYCPGPVKRIEKLKLLNLASLDAVDWSEK